MAIDCKMYMNFIREYILPELEKCLFGSCLTRTT